jgi:hypothetical protein
MMVLLHITEAEKYESEKALLLVITKEGVPCGVTQYSLSYLEDKCPIAFVEGIANIDLTMVSL